MQFLSSLHNLISDTYIIYFAKKKNQKQKQNLTVDNFEIAHKTCLF